MGRENGKAGKRGCPVSQSIERTKTEETGGKACRRGATVKRIGDMPSILIELYHV